MALVADAVAVVLATVFGLACVSKLRAWSTFAPQVRLVVPALRAAALVAVAVVALEAATAGLLLSPYRPVGGVASAGLFFAFAGYVGLTGRAGHEPDGCGCFGRLPLPGEGRLSRPWRVGWRVFAGLASVLVATAATSQLVGPRALSLGIASLFAALLAAGLVASRAPRAEAPAGGSTGGVAPAPEVAVGTIARRGVLAGGMGVVAGTILAPGWWLPAGAQTAQCDCEELLFLCQVRAVAAGIVCTTISGPIAACACLHGVTQGIGCCQECADECSGVEDGCDHGTGSPCAENHFVRWPDAC